MYLFRRRNNGSFYYFCLYWGNLNVEYITTKHKNVYSDNGAKQIKLRKVQ